MTDKSSRLAALRRQAARLEQRASILRKTSDRYATLRLLVFVVGIIITFSLYFTAGQVPFLLSAVVSIALFVGLITAHNRIKRTIARYDQWRRIKQAHVARMALDWVHIPTPPTLSAQPGHPFDVDLDLSGPRSLHHLLDTAISVEGSARLRDWLLTTTPDPAQIARRQALVRELIGAPAFRDRLPLNYRLSTARSPDHWQAQQLLNWLEGHDAAEGQRLRDGLRVLVPLAAVNILLTVLNAAALIPPLQALTTVIYFGLFLYTAQTSAHLFDEAIALSDILARLRAVLQHLERYRGGGKPNLRDLLTPFRVDRPTAYLRRVNRILAAASVQRNPFLWLAVNIVVPWDIYWADRLHRCRDELAARLPRWLDVLFDLETLNSLANYAYLNPHTTFAEIAPEADTFQGEALGHPLIPDDVKVRNDFKLEGAGQVVIITGSNMAGKSSFLRTLGLNLALAYAGGPVDAARLETSLFRLYTCIRVTDSVTDGFSYFYAEVRRLKALLVALETPDVLPLFFLIDEIFRGTNNRERLIGSRAYIRALTGQNGLGMISTHDLELVRLADEMPQVSNYHFREEVRDGRMVFDYKLRPGPSPTTNALKIMQMEGLPVEL